MENHVICVPFPAQGHIRPMLKLAKLLHFKFNFNITFVNTHHIHQTLFKNHHTCSENNKTPFFRFESLRPEGVSDNDPKDILSVINDVVTNKLELPLKELLMSNLRTSNNINSNNNSNYSRPRISCMISDVAMSSFTLRVAEEFGIPAVLFETASACSLLAYFHFRQLLDKGIIPPLQDESCETNGYLEKTIDWIPSLKGICLRDMPTFIRTTIDPNDLMLNIVMLNAQRALNSRALIINTFDVLEQDVLKELSTINPNIYPIGPLNLLVDYHISKNDTISICDEGDEEDHEYMKWLDTQEPNSVLYISFGTIECVNQEKIIEIAWGLANSLSKFLWVVISDQVTGELNCREFNRFEEEIKGRGVLVDWCDQESVLAHPSIGGFLTHCGWNSTIESISYGVPMICWPLVADQVTNAWYCCNRLGIGMKMGEEVKSDDVESMVKELMDKDNGKNMEAETMKWRKLATEVSMSSNGSSYVNLSNVVNDVIKIKQQ
ncbi:7-deoxyloganetin glucosyltransferase isoform X2 [Spinacia oleracea]|uniref:Glycosyltransferase n=1 Tax=Spinacia oleracea TaxID=3562 RepID=A0A9R0J5E2_SPIOL|nr:7-deoxyloganetin glucosyltransferase-like isoform X2 [Spinacia oleracea]